MQSTHKFADRQSDIQKGIGEFPRTPKIIEILCNFWIGKEEGVSWKTCLVRWSCGTEDWYPTKLLENLTRA